MAQPHALGLPFSENTSSYCPDPMPSLSPAGELLRAAPQPDCRLCGSIGMPLYSDMTDRLFDAPGSWNLVACPSAGCGLLWLNPMPLPEDIHHAYRNYYTHQPVAPDSPLRNAYRAVRTGYLGWRFGYRIATPLWARLLATLALLVPHLRARFDFSAMWLPALLGGRVLEIGCGRGDTLQILTTLGWQAEGIDFDTQAVAFAQSRGLQVRAGALSAQSYPEAQFDAVVMSHVIEHLHDPAAAVRECFRVLKPGGRLVLLTPNIDSFGRQRYGRAWLHLDPPRHLHLFNMTTLPLLAQGIAFRKLTCFSVIRDADATLAGSRQIMQHGHTTMGQLSVPARLRGLLLMYIEWLLLLFNPRAGEEIVLLAEK
jgi:2-polyprenyl-3-methyl-5-hydroxy-6-metoxy-1,4-benzoquinol methylase